MSGWPSGLRRQTQELSCLRTKEHSGPRMWAWVQIPLLTNLLIFVDMRQTLLKFLRLALPSYIFFIPLENVRLQILIRYLMFEFKCVHCMFEFKCVHCVLEIKCVHCY